LIANAITVLDRGTLGLDRTVGNQSLQVHASLRSAILDGRLVAGLRLPSSRSLADQLSVRRNAIVGAYEHLLSDGLVETRVGDGTYVASRLPTRADQITVAPFVVAANQRGAFALGQTHSDPMVLRRLASATRRRIASATAAYLGYGDPRGGEALRRQIALHLAANRGIRCDPSCILIVSGTQQGVRLCADALLRSGDRVWMEDPGYPATRNTLAAAGMRLVPVPVDAEGIDVAAGRRLGPSAKAVYVTLSHVRRMRTRYRIARDAIAGTLERAARGALRLVVPTQGLHMLAHLPAGLPKDAAAKIRAIAKIEAWLLSETRLVRSGPDGFILGFAGHDITELTAAANGLGQAVQTYLGSSARISRSRRAKQSRF
jgi:DNA-binding transcriptional MocR family regulator